MTNSNPPIYACPVCHERLDQYPHLLKCINEHNFDIAREGYVNLLLANKKGSKDPGDNKKMILHRRQFLDSGFYKPVSDSINSLIQTCMINDPRKTFHLLDCGCGEGYFLHQLHQVLSEQDNDFSLWGLDISKFAIKAAAKRGKNINWAVASVYDLPILPNSIDFILAIMAPYTQEEFLRVLNHNGYVMLVTPGAKHLFSLREQLYETPQEHKEKHIADNLPDLKLIQEQQVSFKRPLNNQAIVDLFVMTPYSWNASTETREKIMSLEQLEIEVDFTLSLFQKLS